MGPLHNDQVVPQNPNKLHNVLCNRKCMFPSCLQCHFSGTVLYLCHCVGKRGVYSVRHIVGGFLHTHECYGLHLYSPHLFPALY